MASANILQRLLNAAGLRIRQLGQAQAGDDAARLNVPFLPLLGPVNYIMDGLIRSISIDPNLVVNTITLPNPAAWPGQSFFIMRRRAIAGAVVIITPSGVFVDVNETNQGTNLILTGGQGLIFTSDGTDYTFR
jgi:hypothetical protein